MQTLIHDLRSKLQCVGLWCGIDCPEHELQMTTACKESVLILESLKQRIEALEAGHERLREAMDALLLMVNKQAEDDGLWFNAQTAPEGYLQQELRTLHGLIEHHAALRGE